jgi:SAM-dependent methyltransferase
MSAKLRSHEERWVSRKNTFGCHLKGNNAVISYTKTCNIEDFADRDLRNIIRDVFQHELALFPPDYPDGVADSKQWEIAMAVRTLRDHGCLTRQSRILGVGAGTEITSFYLTKHAREVVATDIYANAGIWADVAPLSFLSDPGAFSPIGYDRQRLIPLHMDARVLNLPDDAFDGVYSSGSIEHFGALEYVANSAFEIGRVLKPGGVASIATEFKVAGPPDGDGWDPNVILFSAAKLQRYIIEASGLDLVDEMDLSLSDSTLAVRRDLAPFLKAVRGPVSAVTKIANYPNLILYHEGYLFCSVHLALKKAGGFRTASNRWAAPSQATRDLVSRANADSSGQPGSTLLTLLHEQPYRHDSDMERELERLRNESARLDTQYRAIRSSLSWRVTAPLRVILGPIYEAVRRKSI